MSSYFNEVKFDDTLEEQNRKVDAFPVIDEQVKEIKHQLNLIYSGKSDLISIAIQPAAKGAPYETALRNLENMPCKESLNAFLLMVKQDISRRVAQEFAKLFTVVGVDAGADL